MRYTQYSKIIVGTVALCIMASGCATTGSVKKARSEADDAMKVANEAKELALDCEARTGKTEEMVNRSFKKSMYK